MKRYKAGETQYTVEQAAEIMRHVIKHCIDGGSFRTFIYDRLGFESAAYVPLYEAGVMNFTNACPVNMDAEVSPSFVWAGVHEVLENDGEVLVVEYTNEFPGGGKAMKRDVQVWPGHKFSVGDKALIVYMATATSGQMYALEAGRQYAAHAL